MIDERQETLLKEAAFLSEGYAELLPEGIFIGILKLLRYSSKDLEAILEPYAAEELEKIRLFLEKEKIDINTLNQYLPMLIPMAVKKEGVKDKMEDFRKHCFEKDFLFFLKYLLDKSVIPIRNLFGGKVMAAEIREYRNKLYEEIKDFKGSIDLSPRKELYSEEPEEENVITDPFSEVRKKCKKLQTDLLAEVNGQDQAVMSFVRGYFQGEIFNLQEKKNKPKSYLFFFGPPGTGKTLLANAAARSLGIPSRVFNMSSYNDHEAAIHDLTGFRGSYVNASPGALTGYVNDHRRCVLIFDEFEKAHLNVMRLFLQILGTGRLADAYYEREVNFSETIIIFTSNAGRKLYEDAGLRPSSIPSKVLLSALKDELPPEICSRIGAGNMIMFNNLGIRKLVVLAKNGFQKVADNMKVLYSINIHFSEKLPILFLLKFGGGADGRIASNNSELFLKNEIFNLVDQDVQFDEDTEIYFDVDLENTDGDIRELFENRFTSEILVLCDRPLERYFKETGKNSGDKIRFHFAENVEKAKEYLKEDITAIFIDPLFEPQGDNSEVISVFDYITECNRFFDELMKMKTDIPVFILENRDERIFSDPEKNQFLQEGAVDIIYAENNDYESFAAKVLHIAEALYMDERYQNFSGRGFALDYKIKRSKTENKKVEVLFHGLHKVMAIDAENRNMILDTAEKPDVRFDDVIGAAKAKEELGYFVKYLQNPTSYIFSDGKPPKGILLFGPPGTGKTMLAKAMAGEADVAFLQTKATDFADSRAGESEERIRRMFRTAKKYAPAVIFIDEIDAIGKKRTGSANQSEKMLNTLLTEMGGFDPPDLKKPVFVLAATNFGIKGQGGSVSAELDEALMRRFDNQIYVDLPNRDERELFIKKYISNNEILSEITDKAVKELADRTTGQSPAIIENILNLALRNAQKQGGKADDNMISTAFNDYSFGEKKELSPEFYRKVSVHEAGHAYVNYLAGEMPSYISIESRGSFGGYVQVERSEDIISYTKEELLGMIRSSFAGRAAEIVFFGEEEAVNTGAGSDLKSATEIAFQILLKYGMSDGELAVLDRVEIMNSSLAKDYISRVNEILNREMKKTLEIVRDGKDVIEKIARELEKENHMNGTRFKEIVGED